MADVADAPNTYLYLTDAEGNRTPIVLTLEEYEALLDSQLDLQDAEIVRERRSEPVDYLFSEPKERSAR